MWWESQWTFTPVWLHTKNFLCFDMTVLNYYLLVLWTMYIFHSRKDCGEVNSLDVNNRSCCVLRDVCECWQACSCINIMCRAACIASVLHECLSECYNLSVEICSCLTLSLLDHDCLYQAGLLTICDAVVWQEQSVWFLCILALLLIWVLQFVIACAASRHTTIDYPLVLSQRRDLCW